MLESMFSQTEQDEIRQRVKELKKSYLEKGVPIKMRQYFTPLAEEYRLAQRIKNQMLHYKKGKITGYQITFNIELAELFEVHASNVLRYIQKRLNMIDYKYREHISRVISGRNGGRNSSTKGYKQTKTWSRKKKRV